MDDINRELLRKYFNNSSTEEEAAKVLEWFDTRQGQIWLRDQLNSDISEVTAVAESDIRTLTQELDSRKNLQAIHSRIKKEQAACRKKLDALGPLMKVAAAILVILTASFLYQDHYSSMTDELLTEPEPIHYVTAEDQQKRITLGDGTTVRLNGNSELLVAHDYLMDRREVSLSGEAYFEVAHDADRPFIVRAKDASVEVLGTAFNVKATEESRDIQLAVTEGSVRFGYMDEAMGGNEASIILEKGQFAQLDSDRQTILVEDFGVENYLSWMRGRLVFNELSLDQVCMQLGRLYEIQCEFSDETLKKLQITADFSNDSLEKVLEVISLSLDIDHELVHDQVVWKEEE